MTYPVVMVLALLWALAPVVPPRSADRVDLSVYQWKHRPVLVFAPSATNAAYRQQMHILNAHTAGLAERDIVVGAFFADAPGTINGAAISPKGAARLRQVLGVPQEQFMFVLVGKDGGVKLRSTGVVTAEELFALIDAMPMRRREVRERGG